MTKRRFELFALLAVVCAGIGWWYGIRTQPARERKAVAHSLAVHTLSSNEADNDFLIRLWTHPETASAVDRERLRTMDKWRSRPSEPASQTRAALYEKAARAVGAKR